MRITSLRIRNLRSIEDLQVEFPHNLTAIVGANSTGKSNLFRGLELFFCDTIDRRAFNAALDMPVWITEAHAPRTRTMVQVEFDLSARSDDPLWETIESFHTRKGWPAPASRRYTLAKYYSRGNASGFQCVVPSLGAREVEEAEIESFISRIVKKVEYRYVPSLKDLQSDSFRSVTEELKRRLLSIWGAGGERKEVTDKREKFQAIRLEIEQLIQDAAGGLSESLHSNFPEVAAIKLAMASTQLEEMIGNLDIFADDGHETLMRQKGSGVQGASVIHMLRILRETAPRGRHQKQLFLWNIEEPETFLHPQAQRKLAQLLAAQSKNTQILLTTHSPLFVSRLNPHSNLLLRREKKEEHFCTVRTKLPGEDTLKPIRESLGTSLADSLSLHEAVIIVEGPSDVTIFKKAFERLCDKRVLQCTNDYVAFISGHGASQQATSFSILKSWSPLSRLLCVFDWDKAGQDAVKKLRPRPTEMHDYFYLPHTTNADVVLENMYPAHILDSAKADNAIAQQIITRKRPDGTQIGADEVDWNKDQLANYFCQNATAAEWKPIEDFIQTLVEAVLA